MKHNNNEYYHYQEETYKTYVWSVGTYGCETWVINDTEKKEL